MMKNLRPVEQDCARSVARLREDLALCLASVEQGRMLPLLVDVERRYRKYFEIIMELELLKNEPPLPGDTTLEIERLLNKVYKKRLS